MNRPTLIEVLAEVLGQMFLWAWCMGVLVGVALTIHHVMKDREKRRRLLLKGERRRRAEEEEERRRRHAEEEERRRREAELAAIPWVIEIVEVEVVVETKHLN
jgi:hypothetical protein